LEFPKTIKYRKIKEKKIKKIIKNEKINRKTNTLHKIYEHKKKKRFKDRGLFSIEKKK